jgi:hypothetical protein
VIASFASNVRRETGSCGGLPMRKGRGMRIKWFVAAACCAIAVMAIGASGAFAGEVTGNGKPLWTNTQDWSAEVHTLHGASACAFSGQEDLQFPANPEYDPNVVVGHAQSWGQIPKEVRDFLTSIGSNPGIACNPTKSAGEPS